MTRVGQPSRDERCAVLRELMEQAVVPIIDEPSALAGREALVRSIFDLGLGRLSRAKGGKQEDNVDGGVAFDGGFPNVVRALLGLYAERRDAATHTSAEWEKTVSDILLAIESKQERSYIWQLVKRSRFLAPPSARGEPTVIHPALRAALSQKDSDASLLPSVTSAVLRSTDDDEVEELLSRLLSIAAASGDAAAVLTAAEALVDGVTSTVEPRHALSILGACAAMAPQSGAGDALCSRIVEGFVARATKEAALRLRSSELLATLVPLNVALFSLGLKEQARALANHVAGILDGTARPTLLIGALAEAEVVAGDAERGLALLEKLRTDALSARVAHIDRYQMALSILGAARCVSLPLRARLCGDLLQALPQCTDTFIAYKIYPTHQLLLAEEIVDTILFDDALSNETPWTRLMNDQSDRRRMEAQAAAARARRQ